MNEMNEKKKFTFCQEYQNCEVFCSVSHPHLVYYYEMKQIWMVDMSLDSSEPHQQDQQR